MPRVLTVYYKHKPGGFCQRLKFKIEALLNNGWEVHYIAVEPFPYAHPNLKPHILPIPMDSHDSLLFWIYFFTTVPFFTIWIGIKNNIKRTSGDNDNLSIHALSEKSTIVDVFLTFFSHYQYIRHQLKHSHEDKREHEDEDKHENKNEGNHSSVKDAPILYEVHTYTNGIRIEDLYLGVTDESYRQRLADNGEICVDVFLKYVNNIERYRKN